MGGWVKGRTGGWENRRAGSGGTWPAITSHGALLSTNAPGKPSEGNARKTNINKCFPTGYELIPEKAQTQELFKVAAKQKQNVIRLRLHARIKCLCVQKELH